MALPTAPLGQLPSMNMPYAIPTYDKQPSIWEKALASFLVSAAGGVASRGAENVMSRDNASEFGERNATGFSRLLGPNVSDQEAQQRRSQNFSASEAGKGRTFTADQAELSRLAQAGENDATAANARLRQGEQIQGGLDEQLLRDKNALIRNDQDIKGTDVLTRLKAQLQASDPGNKAQAARDTAAAAESTSRARFNEMFLGGTGATGAARGASQGTVDPSVSAFARGGARGGPQAPAQPADFVSGPADIQRFLAQGMSPEEITMIVSRQQATNEAAQRMPLPDITAAPEDPRLAPLLRQLNLAPQAPTYTRGMMQ